MYGYFREFIKFLHIPTTQKVFRNNINTREED